MFTTSKQQTVNKVWAHLFSSSLMLTDTTSFLRYTFFDLFPSLTNINQESRPTSPFMVKIKSDKENKKKAKAHLIWPRARENEEGKKNLRVGNYKSRRFFSVSEWERIEWKAKRKFEYFLMMYEQKKTERY